MFSIGYMEKTRNQKSVGIVFYIFHTTNKTKKQLYNILNPPRLLAQLSPQNAQHTKYKSIKCPKSHFATHGYLEKMRLAICLGRYVDS